MMDRMTNIRKPKIEECGTCLGTGGLLPLPNGRVVCAAFVVPNKRAWRSIPIAPCPCCGQTGDASRRRQPQHG